MIIYLLSSYGVMPRSSAHLGFLELGVWRLDFGHLGSARRRKTTCSNSCQPMGHSGFGFHKKEHFVKGLLDQTSKESIIECAHDSGGLIGSCTSSRENCECGLCFIIEEPCVGKDSYGDPSYLLGGVEKSMGHLKWLPMS